MAATTHERYPRQVSGDDHSATVGFLVRGADTYADAINILANDANPPDGTPATFAGLEKQRVRADEVAKDKGLFYGFVEYSYDSGKKAPLATGADPSANLIDSYSLNVRARNKRQLWLADLPAGAGAAGTPVVGNDPDDPDGQGGFHPFDPIVREGMNWQGEERGYEGFDIQRPEASFSINFRPSKATATQAYLNDVENLVGKINSDEPFFGRAAETVFFEGARGEGRTGNSWQFTFDFLVAEPRASVDCGNGITLTNVKAWDIIEVTMEKKRRPLAGGKEELTEIPRQARTITPFAKADFFTTLFPGITPPGP